MIIRPLKRGTPAGAAAPARRKAPAGDPRPGAAAAPRQAAGGSRAIDQPASDHAPADHPQIDRDNRHRERVNIPDSRKGKTPTRDRKRNDRTPKSH
jgi:hypothetical protein